MYKIIPKKDLKVINPDTMKRLPEDGVVISKMNTYWNRRLEDKDITVEDLSKKKSSKEVSNNKGEK